MILLRLIEGKFEEMGRMQFMFPVILSKFEPASRGVTLLERSVRAIGLQSFNFNIGDHRQLER